MTSNMPYQPSILICRGQEVFATYRDPLIPNYQGNPLIEALPSILSKREAAKRLARFPPYNESHRNWSSELRLHLLPNTLKFFTPLGIHTHLAWQIDTLIRLSYEARNPSQLGFWGDINQRVESIDPNGFAFRRQRSTAKSLTIIGISGIGKSTAVEEILLLYPQVINHSHYQGRDFTVRQIVWLKLECPHDGSIKGLCLNFFQAVDGLLETSYRKNYALGRRTTDELIPDVARVASLHCTGLLVIDEIQNLSEAKSGGSTKMLSFFVQMINTIGISVVLVGTYKAWSVLSGEFRQIRRGTGLGDLVWEPMKEDQTWQTFVKSLWRYQYVQNHCPLTSELNHTLYYESQGITDFAVKIYLLAQVRAIATGKERVTESIIKSVAKDSLRMARSVLNALKETNSDRKRELLINCEDVYPIDIEPFIEEATESLLDEDSFIPLSEPQECLGGGETGKQAQTELLNQHFCSPASEPATDQKNVTTPAVATTTKRSRKRTLQASVEESLPEIVASAASRGLCAYEALKQSGYIRSATEYVLEDITG